MTLLILFLSEIIPKTIGAVYWRKLARITTYFVNGLIYLLFPLILISERLTKWIAQGKKEHVFSWDEFLAMANIGEQAGHLKEEESRIIRNLFMFESLKAKDIMTPRTVIVAIQKDKSVAEALKECADTPFSRLPIYQKNHDDIIGFILKDDILLQQAQGKGHVALETLKREIKRVSIDTPLSDLLEFFLDNRSHIALVVGEYGGTEGLVTLEDVVETLLGMEIMDEADQIEDMQTLARKQWKKRAKTLGLQIEEDGNSNDSKHD
jgi:CBS domain containing-hemolysin-like protein